MPVILSYLFYFSQLLGASGADTLSFNSLLYNGAEYAKQYTVDMGNPFFPDDENRGDIHYQGNWYRDVVFYYDCEDDVLVISSPFHTQRIRLVPEKVDAFMLNGHSFIKLDFPGHEGGLYELIYSGKRQMVVKWQKQLIKNMQEQSVYILSKRIFFVEGVNMTGITQISDVYDLFRGDKKFLRQVYRDQKLSFRKDPVTTVSILIKAAESK